METRLPPLPCHAGTTSIVLGLLIAADLAFVALFGALAIGLTTDRGFTLTYDRSYAEVFQYVKQYWVVLLLSGMAWKRRAAIYAIFAAMFGFFLVDDYAELHERWGETIADALAIPAMWMLQPYDFGELIVFSVYGVVSFAAVAIGFLQASKNERPIVWELFQLLALVAFFAVVVDALHALSLPEVVSNSIGAVEDGGEMIVFSLILWRLLVHTAEAPTRQPAPTEQPVTATRGVELQEDSP